MAIVEIRNPSGKTEKLKVSRKAPFSIGSHFANDYILEDEEIAPIHCRISWNNNNYEITAATDEPLKINGSKVKHTLLRDNDVLNVGEYEIKFRRGKPVPKKKKEEEDDLDENEDLTLKPLTEEENPAARESTKEEKKEKSRSEKSSRREKSSRKDKQEELTGDLLSEILEEEGIEKSEGNDQENLEELLLPRKGQSEKDKKAKKKSGSEESLLEGIQSRIQTRPVRPGEQEIFRSPLILFLGAGSVALGILGLTFWFIIGRNTSDAHFMKATGFREENKYAQAIESFQSFIADFPNDERVNQARIEMGKTMIEKEINGSVPDWEQGIAAVETFLQKNRDLPEYEAQKEELFKYSEKIAFGAASTAARQKDPKFLDYSDQAQKLAFRFITDKDARSSFQLRLEKEHKIAKAEILKQGVFNEYFDKMSENLKEKKTLEAIDTWEGLLKRYPGFRTNSKIQSTLEGILNTEVTAVVRDETRKEAQTTEKYPDNNAVSLAVHRRSRTGDRSVDRIVVSLAKDCCVGIDTVTGVPVWRRVIGLDSPFFPISSGGSGTRLLMFDTRSNELISIDRKDGSLVWRQEINSSVPGEPLIHEGQIYLSTNDHKLYQIDSETGEILSSIQFNQAVHGPPVLDATRERMIVAGDSSFIYTLSIRPLNCISVSYTSQKSGTIKTPLLRMGSLILVIENQTPNESVLRVFDTRDSDKLRQIASDRIKGVVYNKPVLRGSKLFVTSTGQRITAYNVSDDPNQKQLVRLSEFEVRGKEVGSPYLVAGADNQFWMASDSLREFRLKSDTIQVDETKVSVGVNTQPIQLLGESFYVGRRPFYSQATLFTEVDRETMTEKWQLTLGASILDHVSSGTDSLLCITENGDIFNVNESNLSNTGFRINPTAQLKIPRELEQEIIVASLDSGKVAAAIDKPSAHIWLLTSTGQMEKEAALPAGLQAPPVEFANGLLLPLPGRIKLWNNQQVNDYIAVFNQDEKVTWKALLPVGPTQVIALDSEKTLHRINLQDGSPPSLQKISQVVLENHVDLPLIGHESSLFLINSANELIRLNNSSLEEQEKHALPASSTLNFWKLGNRLLIETETENEHLLETWSYEKELKKEWSTVLPEGTLAGKPLFYQKSLILAHVNGKISQVSLEDHQAKILGEIHQPLTCAPAVVNENIVVCSIDGSLQIINKFLNTEKKE